MRLSISDNCLFSEFALASGQTVSGEDAVDLSFTCSVPGTGATERSLTIDSLSLESLTDPLTVTFSLRSKEKEYTLKSTTLTDTCQHYMTNTVDKLKRFEWKNILASPVHFEVVAGPKEGSVKKTASKGMKPPAAGKIKFVHNAPSNFRLVATESPGFLQALGVKASTITLLDNLMPRWRNESGSPDLGSYGDSYFVDSKPDRDRDKYGMVAYDEIKASSICNEVISPDAVNDATAQVGFIQIPRLLANGDEYVVNLDVNDREEEFAKKLTEVLHTFLDKYNVPSKAYFTISQESSNKKRPSTLFFVNKGPGVAFDLQIMFSITGTSYFKTMRERTNLSLSAKDVLALGVVKFPDAPGNITDDSNFPVAILCDMQRRNFVINGQLQPLMGFARSKSQSNKLILYETVPLSLQHGQGVQFLTLQFRDKKGNKIVFSENMLVTCIVKLQSLAA